ncbi:hypothetical protein CLG96_09075 [Sphingomonas oleivorans]|uniref:Peptidase S8/S53 domain-containing protein n=1 Tax=Sphingomonas oleivorans TaxID=1735121 RepID=A0A2T5FYI2_9SPHN|nr:S8 family peptidase [Sphingomonas oleivorans]PTQ11572.1 hypothetical protein CLG96_09075 [Sphingomonas oleivorans]
MPLDKRYFRRTLAICAMATTALAAAPALSAEGDTTIATSTVASKPVQPRYGIIRPFYGIIRPFYGIIRPFYGIIRPFYGIIRPFYGIIRPFGSEEEIKPFWGTIHPYGANADGVTPGWGEIGAFWNELHPFDAQEGDTPAIAGEIGSLVSKSADFWGAAVQAKTGKSFNEGFADALLSKYGIDPNNPASLEGFNDAQRALFYLDWYDGLMQYSGVDHVDHWMTTINWNPALTQIQGEGKDSVIGLLDFSVKDKDLQGSITRYDGVSDFSNGHGAAVASLLVSAHDGKGVMGIAPKASVVAYNPFDSSGTASWEDVRNGVLALSQNGASIINMSLGVPDWTLHPDWNRVFSDPEVARAARSSVFVIAAGNEGVSQTQNVDWNFATNPNLIVVGSVDPTEEISYFSNKPGSACLLDQGVCKPGNELKNRFIVAPGEFILVSDDKGGVTRASGTSFAAPLVSGTIALLHDRWPWLARHPKESVDIVLKSARDLGAPGVDEVYGVGLLDVTASQSPLNFNNLRWYQYENGQLKEQSATSIRTAGVQEKWEVNGTYFYAFERIGSTFRDFAIPLSSKLVGQSVLSANGSYEQFQTYIYSRMTDWMKTGFAGSRKGFNSFASYSAPVSNPYGFNITMSIAPRTPMLGYRQSNLPYQSSLEVSAPDDKAAFRFGYGDGAVALGGHEGFGLVSDYDSAFGGVNPLLGMASGGGYANINLALSSRWSVSAGATQRKLIRDLNNRPIMEQLTLAGVDPYEAGAQHVSVRYRANDRVTLSGSITRLRESNSLLGVQSIDPTDFANGSTTDGVTFGAEIALSGDLSLSGSGTIGRTQQNDAGKQNIAVGDGGLISSSYEVALTKEKIFDGRDRARFSMSQPMYLEHGKLDYTSVQVIDRQTGEIGPVTNSVDIATGQRQYVAEFLYGRSMFNGTGEMSLFGRAHLRPGATTQASANYIVGGRLRFGF